jgi:hypothetical protein
LTSSTGGHMPAGSFTADILADEKKHAGDLVDLLRP